MKLKKLTLIMLMILATSLTVSAQNILNDQMLRQKIEMSGKNLTNYTFARSAEADLLYKNATLQKEFRAHKLSEGKVDLVNKLGSWNSNLTDEDTGKILTWLAYVDTVLNIGRLIKIGLN